MRPWTLPVVTGSLPLDKASLDHPALSVPSRTPDPRNPGTRDSAAGIGPIAMSTEDDKLKAAAFVVQALDLADDPATIAPEIVTIKQDANAGIFTVQLDSSAGATAFLVYVYDLAATDDEGRSGQELFDAGVATLETAAERGAPGPRIVAHASTAANGFILAATPATYRLLTGETDTTPVEASTADLLPTEETDKLRATAAGELLKILRDGESQAAAWLAALRAEGRLHGETLGADTLPFNSEETELALFLLDERSIQHLLQVLNLILTAARQQAADVLGHSEDTEATEE